MRKKHRHPYNCQCPFCKMKRGESILSIHKTNCQCFVCKSIRGEKQDKSYMKTNEYRLSLSKAKIGRKNTKLSKTLKKKFRYLHNKRKCIVCGKMTLNKKFCSKKCRGIYYSGDKNPAKREDVRQKISKYIKENNPMRVKEYREKAIINLLKKLRERPTSLEKEFIEIIKKHNLPFKYVGNGSFLIGFKNPDFIETSGKKICIEVANYFHHQNNWKEKRILYFEKWGWKTIVFWEDEINDENKVTKKIENVVNNIN